MAFAARSSGSNYVARLGTVSVGKFVAPGNWASGNRRFVTHVDRAVHHHRRGHSRGYFASVGAPLLLDYDDYSTSYVQCGWLRARYEATGLRKWYRRYEACLAGDDD
jgi:hypothetical protein